MELREFSTFTKQGNVGLAYAIAPKPCFIKYYNE